MSVCGGVSVVCSSSVLQLLFIWLRFSVVSYRICVYEAERLRIIYIAFYGGLVSTYQLKLKRLLWLYELPQKSFYQNIAASIGSFFRLFFPRSVPVSLSFIRLIGALLF